MQKGCWKIDQNDEACYIDVEEDEECENVDREYSEWCFLPETLLEEVFSYLSMREKYYASLVCRHWNQAFYLPYIWTNFLVDDKTLTRAKYNYYSGWQRTLDHLRTHNCLARIGNLIRGITFRPVQSFNNIFQFMTILAWCIDRSFEENCAKEHYKVGNNIKSFVYDFPCNMSRYDDPQGLKLFGTGGQMLRTLKILMSKLTQLRILKLTDLVLERYEANHLLDEVLDRCCLTLRFLSLVNVTIIHCPIMHIGCFLNLQVLVVAPQNIDDDVLMLLADSKVRHLHLVQNKHTPTYISISSCSPKAWRIIKRDNPNLRVHLEVESISSGEFVSQPEAPVFSLLYKSTKTRLTPESILQVIDNFKTTLTVYGHQMLPRFHNSKPFHMRTDDLLVMLARECTNLRTLIIREKISTCTVLVLAKAAVNLKYFYIRRNAVILRFDWQKQCEWSESFYAWLKSSCRSYESVEKEVSEILGLKWKFLTDQEFKKISISVRSDYC